MKKQKTPCDGAGTQISRNTDGKYPTFGFCPECKAMPKVLHSGKLSAHKK